VEKCEFEPRHSGQSLSSYPLNIEINMGRGASPAGQGLPTNACQKKTEPGENAENVGAGLLLKMNTGAIETAIIGL
jgi:hypothetical protein